MTTDEILGQLIEIIEDRLGESKAPITMESKLVEDLETDSLDKVELVMDAEEVFNIEIDDEAVKEFITVGDVVKYISTQVK